MNNRYFLSLLLALFFLVGCGQKGPLYLPGDPSTIRTDVPRQEQSQPEENDEDEEEEPQDEN